MFNIIPITLPCVVANETEAICTLFKKCDIPSLHVRKPSITEEELRLWISQIPSYYHNRLHLHDHHVLYKEFSIGGLHLNKRNPVAPNNFTGTLSCSCHSFSEAETALAKDCSYVFLSPVFDSISKHEYKSGFSAAEITAHKLHKIVALGGVNPDNISLLQQWGFLDAAVIGSLWNRFSESGNIEDLIDDYKKLENAACSGTVATIAALPHIIFITHCNHRYNYIQSAEIALRGGIRWIQYRHKEPVTPQQQREEISTISTLCKQYGALFSINDHAKLAANADGLHVGLNDITVLRARTLLGDKIIGGTANTFWDIEKHFADGANYVGVGPFRFTETKKNLSPVLGLQGYKDIIMRCNQAGTNIPVFAIGGIQIEDIPALMSTGIYGIAISSLILESDNPVETVKKVVRTMYQYSQSNA